MVGWVRTAGTRRVSVSVQSHILERDDDRELSVTGAVLERGVAKQRLGQDFASVCDTSSIQPARIRMVNQRAARPVAKRAAGKRVVLTFLIALSLLAGLTFWVAGPAPAASDQHGVGLFDPETGWWELRSLSGVVSSFYFGVPGDYPLVGDWDCDGDETPGVYRQADASVHLVNTVGTFVGDMTYVYGIPGDIPLAGDFNGDGCDTVSVYRPSSGQVFIINRLGTDGLGLGAADLSYYFGIPGDRPFVGDLNGDGIDTVGVQRVAATTVFLRQSHTTGFADAAGFFSNAGDWLVAGDWRGEGLDLLAFYRSDETHFVELEAFMPPHPDISFGESGWLPVAGAFEIPAPTIPLPNLIGLTQIEANQVMADLAAETGVLVTLVEQFDVTDPATWGKIILTLPTPGSEVAADDVVTITVGEPPDP